MLVLEPGSVLQGRYVVDQELRRGPTNIAYRGHLQNLATRQVAIKVVSLDLPPDKLRQALDRFRQEAERGAAMEHPHLAKVEDFFVVDDTACLVNNFIEGESVQAMLERRGRGLPLTEGLAIIRQLMEAVEFCHNQTPPVVFHAIQPPKIIVQPNGQIQVVDFGQSWADNPGSHATDYLNGVGSHGYSPVERYVAEHSVDRVSDVYALGATIYAIFSGRTPPAAVELITGQARMEPLDSLNPEVPSSLAQVVIKAMATQKSGRFQSIAEMRAAIEGLATAHLVTPRPVEHAGPSTGELKVRRMIASPTPTVAPAAAPAVVPMERGGGKEPVPLGGGGGKEPVVRPAEKHTDDLPVKRAAPLPSPARLAAPAAVTAPAAAAPTLSELPEQLRSGVPPVTAVMELEGQAPHLFAHKEMEHVPADVLHIGPDHLTFACRHAFKPGDVVRMRLKVPLVAAGQSLSSEALVTIRTREEQASGLVHYAGSMQVPTRLGPILQSLEQQERRVARRFRSGFRVLSKQLKSYQASATDISATGFGFISETSLPVGDVHEFALDIDDDALQSVDGLKVQGTVVHCIPRAEGGYRVGVHFANLTEAVKRPLYHYLHTFHRP